MQNWMNKISKKSSENTCKQALTEELLLFRRLSVRDFLLRNEGGVMEEEAWLIRERMLMFLLNQAADSHRTQTRTNLVSEAL